MNVISLFTGVGGFDLGLERAGHRIVAQCEADEKARAVLRRHWPYVPIHQDVVTYEPTERADLVCGGFPCQDLSVAGKRAGLAGERSGLFFEAARISDLVLGDGGWVLIENVPGLLSSNGGRDFGVVLATLADLGFYDLAWRVLDSRFFGVPQRRRRVFILARRARGRRAAEVLLEPESGGGNHQASREARALAAASTGPSVDRTGATQSLSTRFGNSGADLPDAEAGWLVANTLQTTAGDYSRADGFNIVTSSDLREPASGGQGDPVLPATENGRRETGSGSSDGQDGPVSPPPDTDGMRTPPGIPGRVDDSVTHSLTARWTAGDDGTGRGTPLTVSSTDSNALCCALDPRPDGPRYAQMGNAVTVNVAEWIGMRLRDFG